MPVSLPFENPGSYRDPAEAWNKPGCLAKGLKLEFDEARFRRARSSARLLSKGD